MKLRTNLSPEQLSKLSKALDMASEATTKDKAPALVNSAEKELVSSFKDIFHLMTGSLQADFLSIVSKD